MVLKPQEQGFKGAETDVIQWTANAESGEIYVIPLLQSPQEFATLPRRRF